MATYSRNSTSKQLLQRPVHYGQKTYVIDTNMAESIGMKELNQYLENSFAKFQPFPGDSVKQLQHHRIQQ